MSSVFVPESTAYPERRDSGISWRQSLERLLLAWPVRFRSLLLRRELARLEAGLGRDGVALQDLTDSVRLKGLSSATLPLWYAWLRQRETGRELAAGVLALTRGMAVQCDMPALRASLIARACETMALSGRSVHVLTPDDDTTRCVYAQLQAALEPSALRLASVVSNSPLPQRREAYRAAVTVLSVREALRDYLGDRLAMRQSRGEIGRKLERLLGEDPSRTARMRGLPFGIVVDANRSLIAQACEPVVVAGRTDPECARPWACTALDLASCLEEGVHYDTGASGHAELNSRGRAELDRRCASLTGTWRNSSRRNTDVTLALKALRLEPGRHYRVAEQRIEFPAGGGQGDEVRLMLEVRERLPVTGRTLIRSRLTCLRFFQRYEALAAVCDDIRPVRDELWGLYGLAGFEMTPPASVSAQDEVSLGELDARILGLASALNQSLAQRTRRSLLSRRARQRYRSEAKLRRSLLRLDSELENITAFSGRAE
ncbi:hypothetical protein GCM10011348_12980 [Marinobacterium nitratireducens]|uniref:SecA family profile domain-containing protein n=1 Tax=Marinobacterium nitratireducens TaxID=518897 RepID=A0A917ZCC9_9GAMM|nr:hypothetical protein [Marinobacterium nitratireducens]GGO79225.1 hypothetical protein GCM10011348_12980 [Marinobacterium nitratireducens]